MVNEFIEMYSSRLLYITSKWKLLLTFSPLQVENIFFISRPNVNSYNMTFVHTLSFEYKFHNQFCLLVFICIKSRIFKHIILKIVNCIEASIDK